MFKKIRPGDEANTILTEFTWKSLDLDVMELVAEHDVPPPSVMIHL